MRAGGQQKVGGGQGVSGACGSHCWLCPGTEVLCAQEGVSLKHPGEDPTFLTISWVIRVEGPILFRSWQLCGPNSACVIMVAKIGLSSRSGDEPGFVLLREGGGVVFLKATSYVLPVLLLFPSCLPFCCSAPPPSPQTPHPEFWKAHLQYLCSLWDGPSVSSHALFVRVVCVCVCFLSFLSLRKLWLPFLS